MWFIKFIYQMIKYEEWWLECVEKKSFLLDKISLKKDEKVDFRKRKIINSQEKDDIKGRW